MTTPHPAAGGTAVLLGFGSLEDRLAAAHGLVSAGAVAASDRRQAARLLQQVDEALDHWARATEDTQMASGLMRLRSSLSGHLLAASTLDEAVPQPSNAGSDMLRRAAETTRAGLETLWRGVSISER